MVQVVYVLLMFDYFSYCLIGEMNWEYINVMIIQLVNINIDDWDDILLVWIGVKKSWFGCFLYSGNVIGDWICLQGNCILVVVVVSYDIVSVVIVFLLVNKYSVYLFLGIWLLMGFESKMFYIIDEVLVVNIINEGGVEGCYWVLKNIMGLWLFQCVLKEWCIIDLFVFIV